MTPSFDVASVSTPRPFTPFDPGEQFFDPEDTAVEDPAQSSFSARHLPPLDEEEEPNVLSTQTIQAELPDLPHDAQLAYDRVSRHFTTAFAASIAMPSSSTQTERPVGLLRDLSSFRSSRHVPGLGQWYYCVRVSASLTLGGVFSRTSTTKEIVVKPKYFVDFRSLIPLNIQIDPYLRFRFFFPSEEKYTAWLNCSEANENNAFDVTAFHDVAPERTITFKLVYN